MTSSSINKPKASYLEIILGPMFSGKTGFLVDIYRKAKFCNNKVIVINYIEDTRYSLTELSTHDKVMIPCIQTKTLCELNVNFKDKIDQAEIILINEGQFFKDLFKWVSNLVETTNKRIYVCGLDGDFKQEKFGEILDLIPISDKTRKLNALCAVCKDGTPAPFSFRCSQEKEQMVIGSDNYIPVCRKCKRKLSV